MTKTARKPRSDSISEMTRIMSGAAREIAPPAHVPLDAMDWPFWESVVAEFARADWSEHQLELAAMMARTMANLELEQRMLRKEGSSIVYERKDQDGNVTKILSCENSRARSVQTLMGQVLAMRRSLAIHSKAQSGSNADAAKQRKANKETEAAGEGGDDLLA